jgi:hypothetical protein
LAAPLEVFSGLTFDAAQRDVVREERREPQHLVPPSGRAVVEVLHRGQLGLINGPVLSSSLARLQAGGTALHLVNPTNERGAVESVESDDHRQEAEVKKPPSERKQTSTRARPFAEEDFTTKIDREDRGHEALEVSP